MVQKVCRSMVLMIMLHKQTGNGVGLQVLRFMLNLNNLHIIAECLMLDLERMITMSICSI